MSKSILSSENPIIIFQNNREYINKVIADLSIKKLQDEIERLEINSEIILATKMEITKLEADNKKLRTCVEFYANKENWQTPESQGFHVDDLSADVSDMIEEIDSRGANCGGNLARQTLAELKESEK